MQLNPSPELEAFRQEVRTFFETEYPAELIDKQRAGVILNRADQIRNQQALQSRGWLATGWPKEYGGAGWDAERRHIFEEEADRRGAPIILPMAVIYIGPVIYTFCTEEQKRKWLPDILASRALWAQGYSEPEAGSDLANLRMSAVREGDHYIVNGTKLWTSYGHWADWIFCLARTSHEERRQAGISLLCTEIDAPGVSVHPIISLDGVHHLNRVEFQNVRIPVAQRIGEEGKGWHYATFLLQNERLSYAHVSRKREDLKLLRSLAARAPADGGGMMLDCPAFAAKMAECEIATDMLDIAVRRALARQAESVPPAEVSALKIFATELVQRIAGLFVELAGPTSGVYADRNAPGWAETMPLAPQFAAPSMAGYLFERAQTIYGGATEVQKNIIWRMLTA